jgi:hypothetical protein
MKTNTDEMSEIRLKVVRQGAVVVNSACARIVVPSTGFVAMAVVEVDLTSKYALLDTYGNGFSCGDDSAPTPSFILSAGSDTLHLSRDHEKGEITEITLPDFPCWDVFCCSLSRYTLRICLTYSVLEDS